MVSFGGETNYANTDHEVHTKKATNSYYLRASLFDFCQLLLVVKFKGDGDGWLTCWLTYSLFHFILSYPVKLITFLSFNSLVFDLLLGLEVLTFSLYSSIVASFSDHRRHLNIHSSPIPFKHGLRNKWCCWWPFFFYLRWNGRGIPYNSLQYAERLRPRGYVFQASGIIWGAFHYNKIFGNFGREINGTL